MGILDVQNIHNNEDIARQRLGTDYILASGRMSITFAAESLRKFFGPEVFNHTGTVNLKFLRPVTSGDTITVYGKVAHQEKVDRGTLVSVDIYCEKPEPRQDRRRAWHCHSSLAGATPGHRPPVANAARQAVAITARLPLNEGRDSVAVGMTVA